ncbi:hypothetical protein ABD68_22600 [Bacillus endophyticus]|uniref:putative ABC transporter permease subunit n=1 Tax=Priestia endophytica TaxID=135735 RepID=UPI0018CC86E0|nr:hypothetical protein [Priestia endophytica]MBG9814260.1 hypothetical protein [Priestia endophytica]
MMKEMLKVQQRTLFNSIRSQGAKGAFTYGISALFILVLMLILARLTWSLASNLPDGLFESFLPYILLAMFSFILLMGIPQVFKNLYSANDLQFLFTMPIPTKTIFWVKYIQSIVGVPLLVFLLFFIPALTFGIHGNVTILFYFVAFVVGAGIVLIGLSIAYLFNLGLIQIVPPSRANELMTVMSALSGLLVYALFQLPNLLNDSSRGANMIESYQFPNWTPMSLGGEALFQARVGSIDFLLPLFFLLLQAIIFFFLSSLLVEKGFRTGWIRLSEGPRKKKKSKKAKTSGAVRHPVMALGLKEWKAISRDLREWMIFMPLGFFLIFPVIAFMNNGEGLKILIQNTELTLVIVQGAFLFIYAVFTGSLAAASIGREGPAAWMLSVLPVTGVQVALGKLWISWLLPFGILSFLEVVAGIFLSWPIHYHLIVLIMNAFVALGISSIGIWIGTIGARYNPNSPQQRNSVVSSLFLLLLSYAYLLLMFVPFVLLIVPTEAIELVESLKGETKGFFSFIVDNSAFLLDLKRQSTSLGTSIGFISLIVISCLVTYFMITIAGKRMDGGVDIKFVENKGNVHFKKNSMSRKL